MRVQRERGDDPGRHGRTTRQPEDVSYRRLRPDPPCDPPLPHGSPRVESWRPSSSWGGIASLGEAMRPNTARHLPNKRIRPAGYVMSKLRCLGRFNEFFVGRDCSVVHTPWQDNLRGSPVDHGGCWRNTLEHRHGRRAGHCRSWCNSFDPQRIVYLFDVSLGEALLHGLGLDDFCHDLRAVNFDDVFHRGHDRCGCRVLDHGCRRRVSHSKFGSHVVDHWCRRRVGHRRCGCHIRSLACRSCQVRVAHIRKKCLVSFPSKSLDHLSSQAHPHCNALCERQPGCRSTDVSDSHVNSDYPTV